MCTLTANDLYFLWVTFFCAYSALEMNFRWFRMEKSIYFENNN